MSRIGKRIILVPPNVTVSVNETLVKVAGPLGELTYCFPPGITIKVLDNKVTTSRPDDVKASKQMHGTTNALIQNMVTGVTKGYRKVLDIVAVGYRAQLNGANLTVHAGYSHPVVLKVPEGIKVTLPKPVKVEVFGVDKQKVGTFAAQVRQVRPPNPYSGKGIMYAGEKIIRKEGKTASK